MDQKVVTLLEFQGCCGRGSGHIRILPQASIEGNTQLPGYVGIHMSILEMWHFLYRKYLIKQSRYDISILPQKVHIGNM